MDMFFKVYFYLYSIIVLTMTIFMFTWKPRKGKWLLCLFVSLLLIGNLLSHLLRNGIPVDFPVPFEFFSISRSLLFMVAYICLLCYIILLRKSSGQFVSTQTENGISEGPETVMQVEHPELSGIGGWLSLHAIGLVLSSIFCIVGIVLCGIGLEDAIDMGYGNYMGSSIFLSVLLLALLIVTSFFFFGKKKATPKLMISLMITNIIFSVILLILAMETDEAIWIAAEIKDLLRSVIPAIIWIPYYLVSKRVRSTFIR